MKKKVFLFYPSLFLLIGSVSSCVEDYNPILIHHFEEMVVNESVERIIIVPNHHYVEVHIDLKKALRDDFPSELPQAEVYRLMNYEEEYFIEVYQSLIEEYEIADAPGLEFEDRNNVGAILETYAWLAFLILGGMASVVIIVRQRSKIKNLQDRVDELEEELRYKK